MIDSYIIQNIDYEKELIKQYNQLNRITLPNKVKKYPYNILGKLEVYPTYKELEAEIKGKKFHAPTKKGGGIHKFYY